MDKHSFASVTLETVSGRLFLTWNDGKGRPIADGVEPLLARERLAQRVQELERLLDTRDAAIAQQADSILQLESALQREKVEARGTAHELSLRIKERDNALVLAMATAAEWERQAGGSPFASLRPRQPPWRQLNLRIAELKRLLAVEESKGRQYCEELAERAVVERDLRAAVDLLETECGHRAQLAKNLRQELAEKAEEVRAAREAIVEVSRVAERRRERADAAEAAIQAGLAHVEKAREEWIRLYSSDVGSRVVDQLDLAREVLTAGKDRTRTTAKMADSAPSEKAERDAQIRAAYDEIAGACADIRSALQRARQGKA